MYYAGNYIAKTIDTDPNLEEQKTGSYEFILNNNVNTLDELYTYILNYSFVPATGSTEYFVSVISGSTLTNDGIEILLVASPQIDINNIQNFNISKLPPTDSRSVLINNMETNTTIIPTKNSNITEIISTFNNSLNISKLEIIENLQKNDNRVIMPSKLDTFENDITVIVKEVVATNIVKETVYVQPPVQPQQPKEYIYKVDAIITDSLTFSQYPAIIYYKDITKIPNNIKIANRPKRVVWNKSTMNIVDVS